MACRPGVVRVCLERKDTSVTSDAEMQSASPVCVVGPDVDRHVARLRESGDQPGLGVGQRGRPAEMDESYALDPRGERLAQHRREQHLDPLCIHRGGPSRAMRGGGMSRKRDDCVAVIPGMQGVAVWGWWALASGWLGDRLAHPGPAA